MPKILIIEDERLSLNVMRRHLSKLGHKVLTASNGEQGIRQLKSHKGREFIRKKLLNGRGGQIPD